MARLALGLAVVWLNFYVGGVDVLPNPVGWAVAALALRQVSDRHQMLWVATRLAAAAGVVSMVTWVPVWGAPPHPPAPLVVIEALLGVAVVVTVCTAFVAVLAGPDPSGARQANVIRWLDPALSVGALALTGAVAIQGAAVSDAATGPVTVLAVLLVATGLAVRVWFLVLVVRRGDPLAGADDDERPPGDDDLGLVERPGQSSGW
jgi:hypothetical protein